MSSSSLVSTGVEVLVFGVVVSLFFKFVAFRLRMFPVARMLNPPERAIRVARWGGFLLGLALVAIGLTELTVGLVQS